MVRGDTLSEERVESEQGFERSCMRWPGLAFEKQHVRALGAAATCWTLRGDLWDFENGAFYLTTCVAIAAADACGTTASYLRVRGTTVRTVTAKSAG